MEYQIRRSAKAKRLRMTLNSTGELTLVLPRFVPAAAGHLFVKTNWQWVEAQRKKIVPEIPVHSYQQFENGFSLTLFDQNYCSILIADSLSKKSFYEMQTDRLVLFLNPKGAERTVQIKTLIENFYRDQAGEYLAERSAFFAEKLNTNFNELRIKNTKSRWGSCSSKKNLNYNWRIMLAPKEVIDYLVVHEVCHLKQMNHSPAFWHLVARLDPNFKSHKKWLHENQSRLLGFLL